MHLLSVLNNLTQSPITFPGCGSRGNEFEKSSFFPRELWQMSQIKVPQMSVLGFVLNYMVKTNPELSKGIVYAFIYMESLEVPRR